MSSLISNTESKDTKELNENDENNVIEENMDLKYRLCLDLILVLAISLVILSISKYGLTVGNLFLCLLLFLSTCIIMWRLLKALGTGGFCKVLVAGGLAILHFLQY